MTPTLQPGQTARAVQIRDMFARIVPRYDLMNRVMTAGQDIWWRRLTARAAQPAGGLVLDLATGTGDLAVELLRLGARRVVAADYCVPMLYEARRKLQAPRQPTHVMAADAVALPYRDGTFDCVTSGFLLRNVVDLTASLVEMYRVLKPGGRAVSLDLTHMPSGPLTPIAGLYFRHVVPRLGKLVSGDGAAYSYLPASLVGFPDADRLAQMYREAGFANVSFRRFGLGSVAIHVARKGPLQA
jgi:demethylmenaquinone methyltransferase / 2-methoxy-6-polyprenyl-1,4-benzoquinol methylase